jgi:hypothetical protein
MVKDKAKESRHETLQHDLVNELKSLRAEVREVAEGYVLSKEGEIETLLDYLLKMPPGRLKAVARPWRQQTRALKLKPAKGRLKDLKKIDALLHDLLNHVVEADDEKQKRKTPRKNVRGTGRRGAAEEPPSS